MIGRDLHSTLSYQRAISPQTQTNSDAPLVGQWIDMADQLGLEFVIATGQLTDTNVTFAVTMDESDDQATITAVAAFDMLPVPNNNVATSALAQAAFTFATDDSVQRIGYVGTKRYVRLTITPTGNDAGAAPLAVVAVGLPRIRGNATAT